MSRLIRCDQCKKELHEQMDTYFTLERSGLDVLRVDDHPGPWHLCSWECLFRYSMGKAAREG